MKEQQYTRPRVPGLGEVGSRRAPTALAAEDAEGPVRDGRDRGPAGRVVAARERRLSLTNPQEKALRCLRAMLADGELDPLQIARVLGWPTSNRIVALGSLTQPGRLARLVARNPALVKLATRAYGAQRI